MGDVSDKELLIIRKQFQDMFDRAIDFLTKNGVLPEIVFINPGRIGDYISIKRFIDMLHRYVDYGEGPDVWIVKPTGTSKPKTENGDSTNDNITPTPTPVVVPVAPPKPEGEDISNWDGVLNRKTFITMLLNYWDYRTKNGVEPICVYLPNSTKYIMLATFNDMRIRYEKYEGKNGNGSVKQIGITKPASSIGVTTNFVAKFADAVGKPLIQTFTEGYNGIKYMVYSGYYNDLYAQSTALTRLKSRIGLNCCDISQLLYQLAIDLGYEARYVHIKCKSGIGHLIIEARGRELGTNWVRVDGASALKSGYNLGDQWCPDGTILAYNPAWMLSDDGIT